MTSLSQRTLRNVVIKSFGQKPSSNDNDISKPETFQMTVHVISWKTK